MNSLEQRRWLAKKLRVSDVPDRIWDLLIKAGTAGEGVPDEHLEDLLQDATRLLTAWRGGEASALERLSPPGREGGDGAQEIAPIELSDYVRERGETLSEFLALLADQNPHVIKYRREVLGAALVPSEEARATVEHPDPTLQWLGKHLERLYGWKKKEARWFVLTGKTPQVKPIEARWHVYISTDHKWWQISLVLSPWVPAKEVERAYRNLQRRLLGRDNRPVERRNLAIFKLGVEQVRMRGTLPSWRSLLQRWNERYPQGHQWHYRDVRNFRRDFGRGEQAVAYTTYNLPPPKLSPEQEQEREQTLKRGFEAARRALAGLAEQQDG